MALNKQPVAINFSKGVDTKTDKWQLLPGQFRALTNSVFNKMGLLQKRNGFGLLTDAPTGAQTLSTLSQGLVALGNTCESYSAETGKMTDAGLFQPMQLKTATMVRRATGQTTVDIAVAASGLACSVWKDTDGFSYYQISDSATGQIVIPAVQLVSSATAVRAFILGPYFVVTYLHTVNTLSYIAIPINNPGNPDAPGNISTQANTTAAAYDGYVLNNTLYLALDCSDLGGAIRVFTLTSTLHTPFTATVASITASLISVTADSTNNTVWVSYTHTTTVNAMAFSSALVPILAHTAVTTGLTNGTNEITSTATDGVLTAIYEVANTYTFSPNAKTDYIEHNTINLAGTAGTPAIALRGVGLGSKAIIVPSLDKTLVLASYGQAYQPTYFLIDLSGNVLARLAYSNGIGYATSQILPSINLTAAGALQIGYLFADLIAGVNKSQGATGSIAGVYTQTGINLATFTLGGQTAALEIGGSLHPSGGMLWQYDGVKIRELGFNVWPEDIQFSSVSVSGHMAAQIYFYQVAYEWTDAAGNIHRSAPSVPLEVNLSGSGTSTNSVTLHIPTLRQTYKTDNKVRIVVYRWSTANQIYYQVSNMSATSGDDPLTLNNPAVDSVDFVDVLADSSIIGNNIIYTTGGVIENICAPAATAMTLFQSRLFMADAEDPNLIWYSKQVIESTPVEMSDLLTLYVAPTTGAQGSTGPITALASMDNNLIVFKRDAIYYINGSGPDNTGAGGTFSDPVYITSTVGCINPFSVVLTPNGIMFQSDKGIWLLGRDLSTNYIGAPVEDFATLNVTSALAIPGTNQVRFTLDGTTAVMYDYYYQQWGDWTNVAALSSVIFEELHTYLNTYGQIVQETPGAYIDVSTPVLISFTTSWFNLAGLQGFERFYSLNLLGQYLTPHKLSVAIGFDYNPGITQTITINPINYNGPYGSDPLYGDNKYGGQSNVESWRLFPNKQKCQSFQITINEIYDPTLGVPAGAGLTLSGLQLLVGIKRGTRTQSARTSVG